MFKCCNLPRQHKAAFKKYKCMCWTSDVCLGYRRQFLYYYQIQSWISTYLLDSYWKYQDERFIHLFSSFSSLFSIFSAVRLLLRGTGDCSQTAPVQFWLVAASSTSLCCQLHHFMGNDDLSLVCVCCFFGVVWGLF